MQLQSLAKSTEALNKITNILNNTELTRAARIKKLKAIGQSYTTETLKSALAQSTLNKEQIKAVLYANGLQGELLETTADELANAASTNMVAASQKKTTGTTIGLGTAFEGLRITIGKAAASLWAFLTTTPTGWATLIIGAFAGAAFAIKKYNDSITKTKENARKRTAELFDEFKEMNDTLADHKKTVAELADRYDELSKGVNLSNNKNISLSADDYEEFLNMNEQLADSFPELTKGIDDNGNSILTLGTKGITAREQLEDLLKTEEDLNNFRVAQGLEDAFKGVYTYIEDADKAANTLNDSIESANKSIEALRELSENGIDLQNTERVTRGYGINTRRENLIYSGDHGNEADRNYINILKASANDFFETLSEERRASLNGRYALNPQNLFDIQTDSSDGTFEIYARLIELTDDEIASLQSIIEDNISSATFKMKDDIDEQLQQSQESIRKAENAWRDFIPSLVAGMKSKQTFKELYPDLQPTLLHFGTSGIIAHYLKNHCKLHAYNDFFYRFFYFIKKQERLVKYV